jgi:hypothetical protein
MTPTDHKLIAVAGNQPENPLESSVKSPLPSRARRSDWAPSIGAGLFVGIVVAAILGVTGVVIPIGSANADSSSAVTATAKSQDANIATAPMPDLSVTVSQTKDLTSQGIVVDWTGGLQSTAPGSSSGGENFLQILQCWGDDPNKPGTPDRTTCQYGAFNAAGAQRDNFVQESSIADEDDIYSVPAAGFTSPAYTSIPFRSATGEVIQSVVYDEVKQRNVKKPVDVNVNQFFTQYTSNEVKWAGSGTTGSGSAKFEVQTALQSPGLGCGNRVTSTGGDVTGASCWLVVIPRGVADAGETHVVNSGLFWDNWKHRIAIKLDFKPLGVTCALGSVAADPLQLAGRCDV